MNISCARIPTIAAPDLNLQRIHYIKYNQKKLEGFNRYNRQGRGRVLIEQVRLEESLLRKLCRQAANLPRALSHSLEDQLCYELGSTGIQVWHRQNLLYQLWSRLTLNSQLWESKRSTPNSHTNANIGTVSKPDFSDPKE